MRHIELCNEIFKKFLLRRIDLIALCMLLLTLVAVPIRTQAQECTSTAVAAGYHDYYYGTTVNDELTAEKPESKLWWNDGFWWASRG